MIDKVLVLLSFYVLLIGSFYMSKLVIADISEFIRNHKTKIKR